MGNMVGTINVCLLFIYAGLFSGLIFYVFSKVQTISKKNLFLKNFLGFFATTLSWLIFMYCIIYKNFGVFNIFQIAFFVVGNLLCQIFIRKMFANPIKWLYNKFKDYKKRKNNYGG